MTEPKRDHEEGVTRRQALGAFAGAGSLLAFGCAGSSSALDADARSAQDAAAGHDGAATSDAPGADADATACAATPEGEIGPYFADDSDARFNRSDITSSLDGTGAQTGIPLALTILVLDGNKACAPYANAQVDIWHCNAAGVYSDESVERTLAETWLRGFQLTDANGKVTFTTIVPGWYGGRTTHIHLRVRSSYSQASSTSDGTNTTQLFFDQTFVDRLATAVAPYSSEGKNPTTNAGDHVYSGETRGANLLSLSGNDVDGYKAAVAIILPIAASTGTGTGGMGGFDGGPGGPDGGGPGPGAPDGGMFPRPDGGP